MRGLLLCVPLLLACCGGAEPRPLAAGEQLTAMALTPHLASLALAIGGDDARIDLLAPEGAHDYDPSVADRRRIESAHLLLVNGLGLEDFDAVKVARAARVTLVDCSASIPVKWLIRAEHDEHGHDEHGHDHGEYNPHVWLCTEGAIFQAREIANAFAAFDKARAAGYRKRFEGLRARLEGLAAKYKPKIAALSKRNFVGNHDAFPYFAREFGLRQVGVIQRTPGHNPTVEQRRGLEKMLKQGGAHAVFMEPGYDDAASRSIAGNSGLPLATLDPFEIGEVSPDALESVLRTNLETVLKTLE